MTFAHGGGKAKLFRASLQGPFMLVPLARVGEGGQGPQGGAGGGAGFASRGVYYF